MTQKELLMETLDRINELQKSIPEWDSKKLVGQIEHINQDLSEIKQVLLNPEQGLVVRVNKNTEFRLEIVAWINKRKAVEINQQIKMEELNRWQSNFSRVIWLLATALTGVIVKLIFFK